MDSFRDELAAIYSNFKSSAKYIRLVFITGVSRFAHLSVFSGLNNLRDISFSTPYSDICGITFDELKEYFQPGIHDLAEVEGLTPEQTILKIKEWYDGYRFCPKGKEIYNPFSVLNLMQELEFRDYWVQTGQPTVLMEQISRFDVNLEELLNSECVLSDLYGLDLDTPGMQALFFQTGYLTIKEYDPTLQLITLGLPNKEVTKGFLDYLLLHYKRSTQGSEKAFMVKLVNDLLSGNADDFMRRLQGFFADISYDLQMESENNFQNAFYILIRLLGLYVEAERRTSDGRIDIFIGTPKYYYIIELKKDATAAAALQQIRDKQYTLPFAMGNRQLICIGASFSTETRTITDWLLG